MSASTAPAPMPVRVRRTRRLCIDAHTEFVATLVAELKASVTRLQSASGRLAAGQVEAGPAVGRETRDIARLVALLDAIDGPGEARHLTPLSVPAAVMTAAGGLDLKLVVTGRAGDDRFVADGACVRTALELLLLALAGPDGEVGVRITGDRAVTLEGTMDLGDPRRSWQLRSGRRVLEGEGVRLRLLGSDDRFLVELSAGR